RETKWAESAPAVRIDSRPSECPTHNQEDCIGMENWRKFAAGAVAISALAFVGAGCGQPSAEEQASSVMSQGQEIMSQGQEMASDAMEQAQEAQDEALEQSDDAQKAIDEATK
ncbi:MAG: hypothetical protein ACREVB_18025, partial [Burkholderiales bacterium]